MNRCLNITTKYLHNFCNQREQKQTCLVLPNAAKISEINFPNR